jgi:ABC-2 type transport system ATP-binding protein
MAAIELKKVYKKYSTQYALADINLCIFPGSLLGLLGPNGSGKTSLFKLLLRYTQPSKGQILYQNMPLSHTSMKQIAGFVQGNPFPRWMKVRDAVDFYKDFFSDFDLVYCNKLLRQFDLSPKVMISKLSSGNISSLKLILVLSRVGASMYLLDEPLEAMDIVTRNMFLSEILNAFHDNCAMMISTHHVEEIEHILSDVIFIRHGHIELTANAEDLRVERNMSIVNLYWEKYVHSKLDQIRI